MEMKTWIIGLVLLGIAIPIINGEHFNDESERRFSARRRISSDPPEENEEMIGIADLTNDKDDEGNQDKEMEMEVNDNTENVNQGATGLLIRGTDLQGSAGIVVFQSGPSSSSPLLFELRPVLTDSKEPVVEINAGEVSDEPEVDGNSDESEEVIVTDNRFRPSSSLDSEAEEDEDEENDQVMTPPKRPLRTTVKPKRKPSTQVTDFDRESMRPTKRPRKPSSQPIRKKRKRNQNRVQSQKKNKKRNKNKTKRKNKTSKRRRKPNNKRRRLHSGSSSKLKKRRPDSVNRYDYAANRNQHHGEHLKKGIGSNTVTNTVTTTQTGSADDIPGVNYITLNKPDPPPAPVADSRPFWGLLSRSARGDEMDRSINPRKRRFKIRSLG